MSGCIERGTSQVHQEQAEIRGYVEKVRAVSAMLDPGHGDWEQRQGAFEQLQEHLAGSADLIEHHMGKVMQSFAPGLFAGGDALEVPRDNLDLERWFRQPKGHERRIHGHHHAGTRIVREGPTLLLALDAHLEHPAPFTQAEFLPYRHAQPPLSQQRAVGRATVMRQARSPKTRPRLLAQLEARYLNSS